MATSGRSGPISDGSPSATTSGIAPLNSRWRPRWSDRSLRPSRPGNSRRSIRKPQVVPTRPIARYRQQRDSFDDIGKIRRGHSRRRQCRHRRDRSGPACRHVGRDDRGGSARRHLPEPRLYAEEGAGRRRPCAARNRARFGASHRGRQAKTRLGRPDRPRKGHDQGHPGQPRPFDGKAQCRGDQGHAASPAPIWSASGTASSRRSTS